MPDIRGGVKMLTPELQVWVAAIATLGIFSFLLKENPVYRFFEYTVVGMAAAHSVVMEWDNYTKPFFRDYVFKEGQYYLLTAAVIGLLYYTRYMKPEVQWLSRYPIALAVGSGIGYSLAYDPRPFLVQIRGTFSKLSHINDWIYLAVFCLVVLYFIFTLGKEKPAMQVASKSARYAMMVYFGIAFGNTVQGRFSLLLGRLTFLLQDWLHVITL